MEAIINIDDKEFNSSAYKQGFDDCIKLLNRLADIQAAKAPYLKGQKELREYMLRMSPQTISKVVVPQLPSYTIGGVTYFQKKDVDKYILAHRD